VQRKARAVEEEKKQEQLDLTERQARVVYAFTLFCGSTCFSWRNSDLFLLFDLILADRSNTDRLDAILRDEAALLEAR
jgi:hypothetical protein